MFDHNAKHHAQGPKHANVPMSGRGPVRDTGKESHKHDPKFEKSQLAKDAAPKKPALKATETPKREAVKPFPGEKGAAPVKKGLMGI